MSGQARYPSALKTSIFSLQSAQVELSDTNRWYRTIVHGLRNNKHAVYLALEQRRRLTRASKGSLTSALYLAEKIYRLCERHSSLYRLCERHSSLFRLCLYHCNPALSSGRYLLEVRFKTCTVIFVHRYSQTKCYRTQQSAVVESTPFEFKFGEGNGL